MCLQQTVLERPGKFACSALYRWPCRVSQQSWFELSCFGEFYDYVDARHCIAGRVEFPNSPGLDFLALVSFMTSLRLFSI